MKKLIYLICNPLIFIILGLVLICSISKAQDIQYTYDPAGNRIYRQYVILRLSANTAGSNQEDAEKLKEEMDIGIFPNPTQSKLYVSYFSMNKGTLSILDGTLRVLKIIELDNTKTSGEIDVSAFSDGFYYCMLKSGNLVKVSKLTIIK